MLSTVFGFCYFSLVDDSLSLCGCFLGDGGVQDLAVYPRLSSNSQNSAFLGHLSVELEAVLAQMAGYYFFNQAIVLVGFKCNVRVLRSRHQKQLSSFFNSLVGFPVDTQLSA